MTTITFDTLSYTKKLKAAGFSELQAETIAEAQAEIFENNIATKQDLALLGKDLKIELATLKVEMANTKSEIIKWVAGMLVAQVAILATLFKLLS